MHATMTDVQKAIEQLGKDDADGSRSFSFASSHGDGDGDWTDRDSATDTDGEADGWRLNARQRLAENSRMINEKTVDPPTPMRISAPPIEVELSDESEAEDDERTSRSHDGSSYPRQHPHIPEEGEDDSQTSIKAKPSNLSAGPPTPIIASDAYIVPSPGGIVDDLPTATPREKSFANEQSQGPRVDSPEFVQKPAPGSEPETGPGLQPEQVPPAQIPLPTSPSSINGVFSPPPSTPSPPASPIPMSPIVSANTPSERARTPIFQPPGTPSSSTFSSFGIQQVLETPTKPQSPFRPQGDQTPALSNSKSPIEWTVEEVVDWLKGKGIDQGTCDQFIGISVLKKVKIHSADISLYRTRYYWRRSSGVGRRVAQDRDRCCHFWQTEASRQRYYGIEKVITSP